jgi:hypothetical protein
MTLPICTVTPDLIVTLSNEKGKVRFQADLMWEGDIQADVDSWFFWRSWSTLSVRVGFTTFFVHGRQKALHLERLLLILKPNPDSIVDNSNR